MNMTFKGKEPYKIQKMYRKYNFNVGKNTILH